MLYADLPASGDPFIREHVFHDDGLRAAARILSPGRGAYTGCGPGVPETADQLTVSAIHRNDKSRTGPGNHWLPARGVQPGPERQRSNERPKIRLQSDPTVRTKISSDLREESRYDGLGGRYNRNGTKRRVLPM